MICPKCNGRGFVDNPRFYSYKTGCNDAYNHGIEPTKKCKDCNGKGFIIGNIKEIASRLLSATTGSTITKREARQMYNVIMGYNNEAEKDRNTLKSQIMEKYSDFPYPLTIIADRYTGCYSGGKYTAWPLYNNDIPEEPDSDDYTAQKFWKEYKYPVGIGDTLQEAFEDLLPKVDKWQEVNSVKSHKGE